jgi:hypothetical protein
LKKNLKYMVGVRRTPQEQAVGTPRSWKWSWKMQGRRCSTKGVAHPTVLCTQAQLHIVDSVQKLEVGDVCVE